MDKWLVISNCNTVGLANSFSLLCPRVEVTGVHVQAIDREVEAGNLALETFDRVFAHPDTPQVTKVALDELKAVHLVPSIFFAAYHPDGCYVRNRQGQIGSPIGEYHSSICFAAYKAGLSVGDALGLYNRDTYARAGYLDMWLDEREAETRKFARHGIDIADLFVKWAGAGPFMYSFNHPMIGCIFDTAKRVLAQLDIPAAQTPFLPHDNLRESAWLPILPVIADACGVEGSTMFKRGARYRILELPAFVRDSYRIYDRFGGNDLVNQFAKWDRVQRLSEIVG